MSKKEETKLDKVIISTFIISSLLVLTLSLFKLFAMSFVVLFISSVIGLTNALVNRNKNWILFLLTLGVSLVALVIFINTKIWSLI